MSRRRVRERTGDLPDWLAEYRPEQWAEDLEDPIQVHYFGRIAWEAAQREWAAGGNPQPKIQTPQTRSRGRRQYASGEKEAGGGVPAQGGEQAANRVPHSPRARPIKSY